MLGGDTICRTFDYDQIRVLINKESRNIRWYCLYLWERQISYNIASQRPIA